MKSLNKKVKALLVLMSFTAYMPISMLPSFATPDANALPDFNSAINGDVTYGDHRVDANVNAGQGGTAQFDWNTFDVGSNSTVNWNFNNANQTAINRVLQTGKASEIYGKLTSTCTNGLCGNNETGKVILINPAGFMFGPGSSVNLNSFTASTKDIKGLKNIKDLANGEEYFGITKQNGVNIYSNPTTYKTVDGKLVVDNQGALYQFGWGNVIEYIPSVDADGNGIIGSIKLDGATINDAGTRAADVTLIADNIDVKNSKIRTYVPAKNVPVLNEDGSQKLDEKGNPVYTYETTGNGVQNDFGGRTRSKVNLITGESAKIKYDSTGASSIVEIKPILNNPKYDAAGNIVPENVEGGTRKYTGITITDNSLIHTGTAQVTNNVVASDLVVNNSEVIGDKVANQVSGQVILESMGDVYITDSRVATLKASEEDTSNHYGLRYGDIDIVAGNNIYVTDSRIAAADSTLNYQNDKDPNAPATVGNINLSAGNGMLITQNKDKNVKSGTNRIQAGGNLNLKAGLTDIVINENNKQYIGASKDVTIEARNIEINGAGIYGANVNILAGAINTDDGVLVGATNKVNGVPAELIYEDGGTYANGSIIINDAIVKTFNGDNNITITGLNTTLKDTLLAYSDLKLFNENLDNLNNVLIQDGTTFLAYDTPDLNLVSNGHLIIDNNKLLSKDVGDTAAQNQEGDITLTSTKSLVTIRNNSDIKGKSLAMNAATDASIQNSNVTALNGDITVKGGELVSIGDAVYPVDKPGVNKTGSTLTAANGKITTEAGKATTIVKSRLNSKANTITSKSGQINIQDGSSIIATEGDNVLTADSNTGRVNVHDTSVVESKKSNVNIKQGLSAYLDQQYTGTVKAAKNININVTGANKNIEGSSLNNLQYGDRLGLTAQDGKISLTKTAAGDNWTITNVDLNSNENKIVANGDVNINELTLGNKTNKTTIEGKNVKTIGNGEIKANGKKLIVNADKDINIAFTGVNNKAAGLEINSELNTKGTGSINQNENNTNLIGRNVTLTAKDGTMAVSKIKADKLNTTGNIVAATDVAIDVNKDNVGPQNNVMAAQGKAYIEVRTAGGWNQDVNVNDVDAKPNFYKESYDEVANGDIMTGQRHKLLMDGDNNNILLVYERAVSECDTPIISPDEPTNIYDGITESTVVRLPRHEEGVSAAAPVLNEITDPTANVIMAAAKLVLDEENEEDEDSF